MKNCPKCGRENRDDATICRECGANLTSGKDGVVCPVCGTENLSDAKFCDKCGKKLGATVVAEAVPVVATNNASQKPKGNSKGVVIGVAIIAVAIIAMVAIAVASGAFDSDDSNGYKKIDDVNAIPLDGTYHLSGGVKLDDGTEYWTVADIVFDNGRLVTKSFSTAVKGPSEDWDSGVNIARPTVGINSPALPPNPEPVVPGHMSTKDSIIAHNFFLEDMKSCNDRYIKLSGGEVVGYGFEDSYGNIYYLLKDGRLAGYSQSYNGVKVLTVLDYHS